MRKVPVFLLAVCLTALLVGCAGQAVPLGGAQIGALSATAVTVSYTHLTLPTKAFV